MAVLDQEEVPYLSHSKLVCWERCPRCYLRQYVLGEVEDTPAMLRGRVFHAAARDFYRDRAGGALPTVDKLLRGLPGARELSDDMRNRVRNALTLLRFHRWDDHAVVSVERPFFLDLAGGLPPVIGVSDLILRKGHTLVVVDHKTCTKFESEDSSQLVLYAEHARRRHATECVVGIYDVYRLVPDLDRVTKTAFRRIPVSVDRSLLPPLVKRYQRAWRGIVKIHRERTAEASGECWRCGR